MDFVIRVYLFLVLQILQWCLTKQWPCLQAVNSKKVVETCPSSKDEWESAARKKNCEELALHQNCTSPNKFKYHCVINSYRNETVEVCAPTRIILGHCTEFNDKGGIIQLQRRAPCNNTGFPKCASYYQSSEAYKFQDCYKLVNKIQRIPSTFGKTEVSTTNSENKPNSPDKTDSSVLTIVLTIVGILLFISGSGAVRLYIVKKRASKGIHGDLEEQKKLINIYQKKALPIEGFNKSVREDLKEQKKLINADQTNSQGYLENNKTFDKYFAETKAYRRGEEIFHKYGIVIWTGPPGCGKTQSAIHLILKQIKKDKNRTFRLVRFSEELPNIEKTKSILILIDDIFSQLKKDTIKNWWKELEKIHENCFNEMDAKNHVRLIITARENVIERACHLMGKTTPILYANYRTNASDLTRKEKVDIFDKQINFANVERNIQLPFIDEEFRRKLKTSKGPIGFPLCAHLFACNDEYKKSGVNFFSRPIEYLKSKIKEEIEMCASHKTKSLFLVLVFHEWQTKLGNSAKLDIKKDNECRLFLENVAKDLWKSLEPLDFQGLENEAQRFLGLFLKEESDNSYKFVHDSVYEAIGGFLCEKYVTQTAQFFPLDIIQNQDFKKITEDERTILATRLISEALHQNLSKVFACKLFRCASFVECFVSELKESDVKDIKQFFTKENISSNVQLPCLFWTSYNKLTLLTELLYNIVCENNLDLDDQLYVLLFGECCACDEYLLANVNWKFQSRKEIKRKVINFRNYEELSILHLDISSEKSDEFVSRAIDKLLNDGLHVDVRTRKKLTPLMFAVNQTRQRTQVIRTLLKRSPKLTYNDRQNSNVFHHCLASCIDDETCGKYLDIFLSRNFEDIKTCLLKNNADGNIPLSIAAMEANHSRIYSILLLLERGSQHKMETLNKDGYSPLHLSVRSLKRKSLYVELECCIRVVIFLLYGNSPDEQSDTDFKAIEECQFDLVKSILRKPRDQKNMEYVIKCIFTKLDLKQCEENLADFITPSITMNKPIQTGICRSIQLLKNYRFDKAT